MIETLRRLGFASRFVSGYLYDAALDGGEVGMIGSGATHAWLQVFLPGAGWMHYDPTNRITAGYDLIPVAIARHPGQAVPSARGLVKHRTTWACQSMSRSVNSVTSPTHPKDRKCKVTGYCVETGW